MMDEKLNAELLLILKELIANWENEVVEFKRAESDYDRDKIGRYFSALSNEANLKGLRHGWLVFGVEDKTRSIKGTGYRNTQGLEKLKHEIAQNTTDRITFTDIFEIYDGSPDMRIIMFKIPAAVSAVPTCWNGFAYGRNGESLVALSTEKQDRIRAQTRRD